MACSWGQAEAFQTGGAAGGGGGRWCAGCAGHTSRSLVSLWKAGLGSGFSKVLSTDRLLLQRWDCLSSPGGRHTCLLGVAGWRTRLRPGWGTVQAEGLGFLSRWPWVAGGQAGGAGPGAGGGAALPGERPWPLGGTQWPDKALITEGKLQQIPTFPPGEPRGSSGHGGDSPAPHEGASLGELWVTGDHGQHPRGPGPPGRQGCWQQEV